jgi:hypothetical protein
LKRNVPAKPGHRDVEELEPGALAECGLPVIRSDKAREFLVASLVSWVTEQGMAYSSPTRGSPQEKPTRSASTHR